MSLVPRIRKGNKNAVSIAYKLTVQQKQLSFTACSKSKQNLTSVHNSFLFSNPKVNTARAGEVLSSYRTQVSAVHHQSLHACVMRDRPIAQRSVDRATIDRSLRTFSCAIDRAIEPSFCSCGRGDDGSLMIECEGCGEWFHSQCVGRLSVTEAENWRPFMYRQATCGQ